MREREKRGVVTIWFCSNCLQPLLLRPSLGEKTQSCFHCGHWFKDHESELTRLDFTEHDGFLDDLKTTISCPLCDEKFQGTPFGDTGTLGIMHLYRHLARDHKAELQAKPKRQPVAKRHIRSAVG